MRGTQRIWYEFFAGGGMARLGLGPGWKCTFANDICDKKARAYRGFFGPSPELEVADVSKLRTRDLPGVPDLVWASFPCQDLSLAGNGAGLDGERSGTFRPFWQLVRGMVREGRAPRLVVLENVIGVLTSHSGRDFTSIVRAFAESGYRAGALVISAAQFFTTVKTALVRHRVSRPNIDSHKADVRSTIKPLAHKVSSEGPSEVARTSSSELGLVDAAFINGTCSEPCLAD